MRSVSADIPVTAELKISAKKVTTKRPLSISKTKTDIPGPLPNTRRALVAPTFPEPNLRISMPFKRRPNM